MLYRVLHQRLQNHAWHQCFFCFRCQVNFDDKTFFESDFFDIQIQIERTKLMVQIDSVEWIMLQ
uniref:LIM domain-containing protein n=1 Tax=Pseudohongiella acticola TaxID=1524254 RepID=UPI0037CAA1DE